MNRFTYEAARSLAMITNLVQRKDPARSGTRVLMLHDLNTTDSAADLYSLPVSQFESGIRAVATWVTTHARDFVALSNNPIPGVAVTFDDGYKSTLTLAAPILSSLGIPFHVFVTKSYIEGDDPRFLRPDEIKELSAIPGVTVGVHGVTHQRLTSLNPQQVRDELAQSRDWLEQLTGRSVTSMSYPHGDFSPEVSEIAKSCGLKTAACSRTGTFTDIHQAFAIPRIDIWAYDKRRAFLQKTLGSWDRFLP